ncbi:iron ABC transporter permease [Kistimonas scapharcae]|uniref:Iron ABC transporter permease n=1 Tax=Kistimonas scapharcae TaxID=1036133 RepID=A0ABP8V6G7_9GAMM
MLSSGAITLPDPARSPIGGGRSVFRGILHRWLGWRLVALAIAGGVAIPVIVLLLSWHYIQVDIWQHLIETQLARLLGNTAILVAGVGVGVTVLGVALAALVTLCEFPGRKWLDWALILPFAIPAYVLAFVYLGVFDFSGPLQGWLRAVVPGFTWVDIRGAGGMITTLVLVFYPYVYMLARTAFLRQGRSTLEAARLLGLSPLQAFFRVTLPMARPAIAGGVALALMETMADFGAVSVFNYDTLTTAIYKTWYGFFNLQAAAQLASLLLLLIFLLLAAERWSRGRARYTCHERQQPLSRTRLTGAKAWLASSLCLTVFSLAFVIPVVQLLYWIATNALQDLNARYLELAFNTLLLAASAAGITVVLALLLVFAGRMQPDRCVLRSVRVATTGYALPGSVLAVGVMTAFSWLDHGLVATLQESLGLPVQQVFLGSWMALVLAYCIRFLAVAFEPLSGSIAQIRPALQEAAKTLGADSLTVIRRVYLPMLAPGVLTAALLVFVDVLKEMPATLLMRPFGWDTLAVRIHEMTSEGHWERAALPALTLVIAGFLPVVLLMRRSAAH